MVGRYLISLSALSSNPVQRYFEMFVERLWEEYASSFLKIFCHSLFMLNCSSSVCMTISPSRLTQSGEFLEGVRRSSLKGVFSSLQIGSSHTSPLVHDGLLSGSIGGAVGGGCAFSCRFGKSFLGLTKGI